MYRQSFSNHIMILLSRGICYHFSCVYTQYKAHQLLLATAGWTLISSAHWQIKIEQNPKGPTSKRPAEKKTYTDVTTFPPLYYFCQWPAYTQQFTWMLLPMFKVLSDCPFLWKEQTPCWFIWRYRERGTVHLACSPTSPLKLSWESWHCF